MQFGLSEAVAHWGRYGHNRVAVVANGRRVSYGTMDAEVNRLASALIDEGAPRIAVACACKYNLLTGIVAILRAGKGVVLVNPGLGVDAIGTNLADADVQVVLHDGGCPRVSDLVAKRGGRLISVCEAEPRSFGQVSARSSTDEWGVLYSSGTTGTPKGIERDHQSMVTEFLGWILELGLNRNTSFYIGRPIYYTGGLVLAAAMLVVGGTVILNDSSDDNDYERALQQFTETLDQCQVDWAFFVPDQVRGFLKGGREVIRVPPPGSVLVMGGPISGSEKVALAKLLKCDVVESWGNSESLGTITEPEDLKTRPDSIGRPFVCDELCVVDESLQVLPPRRQGRIAGGVEAGFLRYSNRPDATAEARRAGLIISEDYGYQDDDGYFYILGRVSDCVVRDGKTLFLSQVEAVIRQDPVVSECCVTTAGDENNASIVAIVQPAQAAEPDALRSRFDTQLPAGHTVDRVLVMAIPKLPSGKIDRVACRRIAADATRT